MFLSNSAKRSSIVWIIGIAFVLLLIGLIPPSNSDDGKSNALDTVTAPLTAEEAEANGFYIGLKPKTYANKPRLSGTVERGRVIATASTERRWLRTESGCRTETQIILQRLHNIRGVLQWLNEPLGRGSTASRLNGYPTASWVQAAMPRVQLRTRARTVIFCDGPDAGRVPSGGRGDHIWRGKWVDSPKVVLPRFGGFGSW